MISADRMKSVRIAPEVICFSASSPTAAVGAAWRVVSAEPAPHLLRPLVAEVGGAEHQDRRQQPRHELTEQQRGGQDENQLVAQGSDRDPLDHRQFAIGGDAVDVLGRHRGVVDDDARRLGGRAPGGGTDVVDRCGREPGQSGNVVEEPEQTRAHRVPVMATEGASPARNGVAARMNRISTSSARPYCIASTQRRAADRTLAPGPVARREWRHSHRRRPSPTGREPHWRHRFRGRRSTTQMSAHTPLSLPPGGNQYAMSHEATSSSGRISELMVASDHPGPPVIAGYPVGAETAVGRAARFSASHSRMLCRMVRPTSRADGTM